ncbi:CMRF35-like molecule 8 [Electrophorus electricus]|uniref:CMRF35-like molecule 8 n=1 Tax=Electrophorus electricus TaxID=8005 RepID=UPI0015D0CF87|nr:CMRF35-like molecule 8 [Electrophorus electricus]
MKTLLIFTFYLSSVTGDSTNEVTAYSGGGIKIKCKYEDGHEKNNKYFCKGESTPCADQIKTGAKHTWVHEGRFCLYDDTNAKVFWVVMRNLTVEDSGTYQCGVDIERWTDTYRPVKLKVKADPQVSSAAATITTAPLSSSSSRFPSSTVISVVCVILVLLLMGTSFLIVTLRKRSRKEQESASSKRQSLQDSSHIHGVPLSVCDNEIKDTRSHSDSDTGAPTVYSTVHLPTNLSDPSLTVYAQAQLPTNPCDFTHTVSANAIILSENFSVCDAQQSARMSDEPLIYTTVKFYKNADGYNDAVKETFKMEEDT